MSEMLWPSINNIVVKSDYEISFFLFSFRALGLPVSVYENNDCRLLLSARNKKEKYFKSMVEVERLREKIGLVVINSK